MGALLRCLRKPEDNSEQATPNTECFNEVFMPHTVDQPCDVILEVEDGKQFKSHRQVLSEESPFFEKMPSSEPEHVTANTECSNEVFMPKDTLDQPCDITLAVEDGKQFKSHRQVLSEESPFFEKMPSSEPVDNSEHVTANKECSNEVFMPKDTVDQPCDVILVVEDGKQFTAHRQVLSEASPFFEKMLSSDMKESKEGMVRLEMFSESVMGNALEFIYTGSVQILAEDSARDLIVIADYLFLENLKTLAEGALVHEQKLNTSNCISTYYFSQRYRCEGLFAKSKTFILANFTAVYEANREEVLNMSRKEIEMWISSDEIDVSAEEDVFKIILAWIDRDRRKRKKYFAELFRQVRLVYVSRDFLSSDIVTNDLVKDNEGCLDLVEDAMRLIDAERFDNLIVPRKSLETPVMASVFGNFLNSFEIAIVCYQFSREGTLCSLPLSFVTDDNQQNFFSCPDKLYSWKIDCDRREQPLILGGTPLGTLNYINLYSRRERSLPWPYKGERTVQEIFVSNDELYALTHEYCPCHFEPSLISFFDNKVKGLLVRVYFAKYKPESNVWEDLSSFHHLALRRNSCIVAKDNFVYFIGGEEGFSSKDSRSTSVDRYDLSRNKWRRVANMQKARSSASGAAANGKLFVAGGTEKCFIYSVHSCECEVYDDTTNEWQFIRTPMRERKICPKLLSVDGKLYAHFEIDWNTFEVDCYGPDKHWNRHVIEIPRSWGCLYIRGSCSMRIFKGFLKLDRSPKLEISCND